MKKITLFILFVITCFSIQGQITNTTGITGDDLIYHEDGRTVGASGYTINITGPATIATNGGTKPANDSEAGYIRPTNNYDNGVTSTADYGASLKTNNVAGGANTASTMWYVVNSVDLSTYDGGSKYFTIVTYSQYFENGSDNIDDQNEFWYRNSATGADPTSGNVWTKIPSGLISSHANGVLGKDATWVATKVDLSSITCGNGFAIALKRTTSADGPNPGKTVFGSGDNRNGSFFVSSHVYTGTTPKTNVAPGDFSALNTSATSQPNIFNTPTAAINNANFTNTNGVRWGNVLLATNDVPRLYWASGDEREAPVNEGYKFEVSNNYNPIVISEVRYTLANARSNNGTVGGLAKQSTWKVQASNDDTNWDDISEERGMFSNNSGTTEYSFPLSPTKAYRYYRFVLAEAWTPTQKFTALQQLDFTVASLWTGTTDNDWSKTTNWNTNAIPTTAGVIIPSGLTNYPTIATGTTVSTSSITIESGASLIAEGTSTVGGNVTYKRNLSFTSGASNGWHLVGSPVTGQAYNDTYVTENSIASGTESSTNRGIATYTNGTPNATTGPWTYLQSGGSGTFDKATGYSIKTSKTTDISFTGTLNTTDPELKGITIGAGTPFNLIANPFTAYINAKTFLELPANSGKLTNEQIWVWNPTSKNYDSKLSGDTTPFQIAPGQAFFVSSSTAGNLEFVEGNQSHQSTDTFLRTEGKPQVQLNITNGELNRYAKINYNDNATKNFDNGYDGETFSGVANKFDVFTQLLENNQGKNYQIQSLPNTDLESMVIPVGIKSAVGEITFSAEALNLPSGLKVFLEDRSNNTFTRLDEANASYKITLTEGLNGVGRFYIHTAGSALSIDKDISLENVSVYKTDNSTLRIVGLQQGKTTVKLFNILGKQVMNTTFKTNGVKELSLPKLAKGVYIVQLSSETGKLNKKIILE